MARFPVLLLCTSIWLAPAALKAQQEIRQFVTHNSFPVTTIDPRADDYKDLEIIGKSIGSARVVMLGEQDHGDALTFSAKTRLIRYLHEKMGFNVIAFESDFFALNMGWEKTGKQAHRIDTFLMDNLLHLWAKCRSCSYLLYNYIPNSFKTRHPLTVTGFDNQLFLHYSLKYLLNGIDSLITSLHLPIGEMPNYTGEIKPLFDTLISSQWYKVYSNTPPADSTFRRCDHYLKLLKQQAAAKLDKNDCWLIVIDNLISQNKMLASFKKARTSPFAVDNIRDARMALNLQWLLQMKYPGEKIIVWAANNHVARYHDKNYTTMGYWLAEKSLLKENVYIIGFTSFSGSSGRWGNPPYTIKAPKNNSVENWINPVYPYAFVDYKRYNEIHPDVRESFNQRGWRYRNARKAWNRIYDGVFFIREMRPCSEP